MELPEEENTGGGGDQRKERGKGECRKTSRSLAATRPLKVPQVLHRFWVRQARKLHTVRPRGGRVSVGSRKAGQEQIVGQPQEGLLQGLPKKMLSSPSSPQVKPTRSQKPGL